MLIQNELTDTISNTVLTQKSHIKFNKILDAFFEKVIYFLTIISACMVIFIFIFIILRAWDVLKTSGLDFVFSTGFGKQIDEAYADVNHSTAYLYGAFELVIGSLLTVIGSLVIAIPLGIGTATVISELAPRWIAGPIKSIVRLLASIPSVIFGLVGLMIVVPFILNNFINYDIQEKFAKKPEPIFLMGGSLLAGIIVLSIMILPIIIALSVDALNAVPYKYKEASLALGLSHWRTIVKVIIPAAKSGILAGIILGTGRAMGEAIALTMTVGAVAYIPQFTDGVNGYFLSPVLPIAAAIVNKASLMSAPPVESALFACGILLLITCASLSLFSRLVEYIIKRREGIE
jgi:phosphate transport system permease protein